VKTPETVLRPVHPNAGIEAYYRRRLTALVDEMAASVAYWLTASYRANEPEIAQDGLASNELRDAIRKLVKRWQDRFNEGSDRLAEYFSQSVSKRSDAALKKILKDAGFSVEFKMTRAQRDVLNATVNENVALIKSIPAQYLTQVEGIVMRGVSTGRDLAQITKDLQEQHGVTRRRAAFIARDQSNKATASLSRARMVEIGVEEAIWVHSGGGKHPRPSHLKAGRDRVRYDVKEGWLDPAVGKHILPGELINCRCIGRAVIKGFS
jgi:uncharacterized protein with gpF-like domain